MSLRLWDLDWGTILPLDLDGVRVTYESFEDARPFIEANYRSIFNVDGAFYVEAPSLAKQRFTAEMDLFVFRHEAQIVGVVGGHPSDWSTYYWRTAALLPEFRARGAITKFCEHSYEQLRRVGVNRIELDTCPGNRATMSLFLAQGFVVTSTAASERWGFTIRFTKFLNEQPEGVFRRQFLDVPR